MKPMVEFIRYGSKKKKCLKLMVDTRLHLTEHGGHYLDAVTKSH